MVAELFILFPAILVCVFVAGFKAGRGRAKRPIKRIELGPNICQCEHPISFHAGRARSCNARTGSGHNCRCEVYTSPFYVEGD